ncbi:MAG: hypothetical protein A2Y62_14080 [Candidatus Fischerbacteria bacterium RBG_13_37_8]|uniref:DUF177 domain-containing protein n=1 Tax=Candidatus Fischerbacteria bacterium RBG_13_37_8 TaxID=1817863 RepID=A0A1F5VG76_9BACT|nr:MAG: hypothetical protein A2Y62_14080 [Candidatus Fischerbacteria bacterium RBG_13_37_8]
MGYYRESVDVKNLGPKGYQVTRSIKAEEIDLAEDNFKIVGEIVFSCNISGNEFKIQADGTLSGEVELMCDRCSRIYTQKIAGSFSLIYLPIIYCPADKEEVRLYEKDLEVSYFDGEIIELHEIIREQILLMVPIKNICTEKCKGLCSKCGVNLNEEECQCEKGSDERWNALRKLIHK